MWLNIQNEFVWWVAHLYDSKIYIEIESHGWALKRKASFQNVTDDDKQQEKPWNDGLDDPLLRIFN